jgi:hypothetical protein
VRIIYSFLFSIVSAVAQNWRWRSTIRASSTDNGMFDDVVKGVWSDFKPEYKACSKKDRTFAIKILFYNILSTVPFKVVPSTDNTPLPTFHPLLECFLERTFCDGAQFSYRVVLNLRVLKKRRNVLNSSPTSTEGALRLLSAPNGRFWQQTTICPVSLWTLVVELHPLNWTRALAVRRINPTRRIMLITKRGKWQFVVKTCR